VSVWKVKKNEGNVNIIKGVLIQYKNRKLAVYNMKGINISYSLGNNAGVIYE